MLLPLLFFAFISFFVNSQPNFPIGVNLSPLGGNSLAGNFGSVNWDPISAYVFVDIFKHCSAFYPRSTWNGGTSFGYQSTTSVAWRTDGYPASLPYTSASTFWAAICDMGVGGAFIRNGLYKVMWEGTGNVGFSSNVKILQTDSNQGWSLVQFNVSSTSTSGVSVRLLQTSSSDPLHNLRIVPVEFASNYTQQIFHPSFLSRIQPFSCLRFTGWQKIQTISKTWATRTTPSFQTQHTPDGVAIEYMVALTEMTQASAVWFSFPLASADYNQRMIQMLADSLPRNNLTIYFESGAAEIHGDTNRYQETVQLTANFNHSFADLMFDFHLKPTASVFNMAYVSYVTTNWFGPVGMKMLKAVAVPAMFGRSYNSYDNYSSFGTWSIGYANWTQSQLQEEMRSSVLVAEATLNQMKNRYISANPNLEFVSYMSGSFFSANNYGYRYGKNVILNCASKGTWPCSWANTGQIVHNQSELNALMPMINQNATAEQIVEDKLLALEQSPPMEDILMDLLRRWGHMGGGTLFSPYLLQSVVHCSNGGKGCGSHGMFESGLFQDCSGPKGCPKYMGMVRFISGELSSLPFTSNDLGPDYQSAVRAAKPCNPDCVWGTCYWGVCQCFAGYTGPTCESPAPKPNDCNSDTGLNLGGLVDWSSGYSFVDLFRSSRAWISQTFYNSPWSTGAFINVSKNDYPAELAPNQLVGAMMIRDLRGHVPAGTYICLYDGDGILSFGMDIVKVKRQVGRIEVTVKPSNGLNNGVFLTIERTNPLDPVRNIRFILPGYEDKYLALPFHPVWINKIQNFKTLRFMDWMNTNDAKYGNWSDRATRDFRSYSYTVRSPSVPSSSAPGVPVEDMVLLANMVGAEPWFNMPHLATDEFVRNFAQIVFDTLRPDVNVYVEYSNEAWGTLFSGGQYSQTMGIKLGYSTEPTLARLCFYAVRSSQMFKIWQEVFGVSSDRLKFVYNSQAVQPYVSQLMLQCAQRLKATPLANVLAIAPYFGSYDPTKNKNFNVFMNTTLPSQIKSILPLIQGHKTWAKKFNMTLESYECGQGMAGSKTSSDFALLANRDSRMSSLYQSYTSMLRQGGMTHIMQFSSIGLYDTSQTWGLLEATDQDPLTSPKFQGLQAHIRNYSQCTPDEYDASQALPQIGLQNSHCLNDCSGSGVCVNGVCECYYGSSGASCEITNYNDHKDQCGYYCNFWQGTCSPSSIVGTERYWSCKCKYGYYGFQCSLFDCKNDCNYNGRCMDMDTCSCFPGFTGPLCEIDCGCGGHGVCAPASTTPSDPTCLCDVGWKWSIDQGKCIVDCASSSAQADPSCLAPGQPDCGSCQNGFCFDGTCECWAGYSGADCTVPIPRPNSNSRAGVNVGGIAYYVAQWVFVDSMKMSGDWVSSDIPDYSSNTIYWDNKMPIHLRPDGYPAYLLPGQIVQKLMLRDIQRHAPPGQYVCLYDGEGVVDFRFDASVVATGKGRVEFLFKPSWKDGCTDSYCGDNGILLQILKTNPSNPIRNIRVIMPGFEYQEPVQSFHPYFLKNIQYYSTLRFMDWGATNNNNQTEWINRPLPTSHTQSDGVAVEYMVQLSNLIGASPWFCMPHLASDDYVRQFALLVNRTLRSDVEIYLEYSNEVWNTLFSQGNYAQARGLALGLSTNKYTAQYRFYSQRSVEIFNIWKSVFAGSGRKVNYILSTWTLSSQATNTILSWKNAFQSATAVGVTGYFDCYLPSPALTATMSTTQIINRCLTTMNNLTSDLTPQVNVARQYGLPLVTYEAGQSLVEGSVISYGGGGTPGLANLFIAVNRDQRMEGVYYSWFTAMSSVGLLGAGLPLMQFTSAGPYSKYGSWGAIEFTGQAIQDTPKYRALSTLFNPPPSQPQPSSLGVSGVVGVDTNSGLLGFSTRLGDFTGYPVITSPSLNDIWVSGQTQTIKWNPANINATSLAVYLWMATAQSPNFTLAQSVSTSTPARLGSLSFMLTHRPPASATLLNSNNQFQSSSQSYFIELRSGSMSNFSSFFNIVPSTILNFSTSPASCLKTSRIKQTNPLKGQSVWIKNPASNTCPTAQTSPYGKYWSIVSCTVDLKGCRTLLVKINPNGTQAANWKPVTDCVSQGSPFPPNAFLDNSSSTTYSPFTWTVDYTLPSDSSCFLPTMKPTPLPSYRPTQRPIPPPGSPTNLPTSKPTRSPTSKPSVVPTIEPSARPTRSPTLRPSAKPTTEPTSKPTFVPTSLPSFRPTPEPSSKPSFNPTTFPSQRPSPEPTSKPSFNPTTRPTARPSVEPTTKPSFNPTTIPSRKPTFLPSFRPPTTFPSTKPTPSPTSRPSSAIPSTKPTTSPTSSV